MFIVGGFNVYPRDVEEILYSNPKILEAAVIGKPNPRSGETVKAFIVLKPGHTGDPAMTTALQAFVKQQIAPYKYPRAIEYVAGLPRTETGKLQRFLLRPQARAAR